MAAADQHARPGESNANAKVTEAVVRAWRRKAAALTAKRQATTGGINAKTGAPLSSLLRRTGLFARLAREHEPPVSVAAVCMAVYGDTWAHVPGALPRYVPGAAPDRADRAGTRGTRGTRAAADGAPRSARGRGRRRTA